MFPAPKAKPAPKVCAWCGAKGTREYEVEPAIRGTDKRTGAKTIKRRAITAPACVPCYARLDERNEKVQAEAQRTALKPKRKGYVIQ